MTAPMEWNPCPCCTYTTVRSISYLLTCPPPIPPQGPTESSPSAGTPHQGTITQVEQLHFWNNYTSGTKYITETITLLEKFHEWNKYTTGTITLLKQLHYWNNYIHYMGQVY